MEREWWENLIGGEAEPQMSASDYRELDKTRLAESILTKMLYTKQNDPYCSYRDKPDDEIRQAAEKRAEKAVWYYGGLVICGKCKTPKEAVLKLKRGITKKPSGCMCAMEAEAREKAEHAKQERREWRESIRTANDKTSEYASKTFDADDNSNPKLSSFARNYCEDVKRGTGNAKSGIIFYGTPGTGKTFMASCIINELEKSGFFCHTTTVKGLLDEMWNEESKNYYLSTLRYYSTIMIDDLGAEHQSKSGFELDQLSAFVDELELTNKRVIITTNCKLEDFSHPATVQEARVYDRLPKLCQFRIAVNGQSRRRKEVAENYEKFENQVKEWMQ